MSVQRLMRVLAGSVSVGVAREMAYIRAWINRETVNDIVNVPIAGEVR